MDVRTKEELDVLNGKLDLANNRLWWIMTEINPKKVAQIEKDEKAKEDELAKV